MTEYSFGFVDLCMAILRLTQRFSNAKLSVVDSVGRAHIALHKTSMNGAPP
jgi:hypothetical protein